MNIHHKLFIVVFSILLSFSVMNVSANASFTPYCAQRTGTIERPVRVNGKVYPAGTPLYGAHDGSRIGKNNMISAYIGKPNKNDGIIPKWALKKPKINKQFVKQPKLKKKVVKKPKVIHPQRHKIIRHKVIHKPNDEHEHIEAHKNKSLHDAKFAGVTTAVVLIVLYMIKRIA